jgi:hypothetical protein
MASRLGLRSGAERTYTSRGGVKGSLNAVQACPAGRPFSCVHELGAVFESAKETGLLA